MGAQDNTEKVLRSLHVLLSKSEPYPKEPSKVIIDKQQVIDLLAELNTCIYQIMDEYELTIRSRDKAERDFHKKGDQIIWDASRKAEDIYAASVMYMDETLNRMQDIMQEADKKVGAIYQEIKEQMEKEEQELRTNKSELKGQLQDLVDTEKYLKIIEERNREIEKEKMEGRSTTAYVFQRGARDIDDNKTMTFGGKMMLSAYHIGSHDTINETYRKIFRWADNHGYKCGNSSIERYVTDYWTIRKSKDFVTEIFVDIVK